MRSSFGFFRRSSATSFSRPARVDAGAEQRAHDVARRRTRDRRRRGSRSSASSTVLNSAAGDAHHVADHEERERRPTSPRRGRPRPARRSRRSARCRLLDRLEHRLRGARGVNARATMPRWRAWRGSSMLMNEPKNSIASAGHVGDGDRALAGAELLGLPADLDDLVEGEGGVERDRARRAAPGCRGSRVPRNGPCSRIVAKSSMRSCSGRRQNRGSAMSWRGASGREPSVIC